MIESNHDEQIVDLQTRLSFQEDTLQAMSLQMAKQAEQLRVAEQHIRLLNEKINVLNEIAEQNKIGDPMQKPPHY